jgi:hypothetical protein
MSSPPPRAYQAIASMFPQLPENVPSCSFIGVLDLFFIVLEYVVLEGVTVE